MFKFVTRIPLTTTVRTTSGWSKPIVPLANFKSTLFPSTRSFHSPRVSNELFKPLRNILINTPTAFQMKIIKHGPTAIQIRCFAEQPSPSKNESLKAVVNPTQPVTSTRIVYSSSPREQVLRFINASLSLFVTLTAMSYGSLSLFIIGSGGIVMSVFGSLPYLTTLFAILLVVLFTITLYPALVLGQLIDITLHLQKMALTEIMENPDILNAIGTPLNIVPQTQREIIHGTNNKDVHAQLVFEVAGSNGKAFVDVVGHSVDNGIFKRPSWVLQHIVVEQLDEHNRRNGNIIYEKRMRTESETSGEFAHA